MTASEQRNRPISHAGHPSQALSGASHAFLSASRASSIGAHEAKRSLHAASYVGGAGANQQYHPDDELTSAVFGSAGKRSRPVPTKHASFQGTRSGLGGSSGASDLLRTPSPSHMAARLAVSRATPSPTGRNPDIASAKPDNRLKNGLDDGLDDGLDETSVPATKSLVQLYEAKQEAEPQPTTPQSIRYANPALTVVSPKPRRPSQAGSSTSADILTASLPKALARSSSSSLSTTPSIPSTPSMGALAAASKSGTRAREVRPTEARQPAPKPPPPRRSQRAVDGAQDEPSMQESHVGKIPSTRPPNLKRNNTTTNITTQAATFPPTSPPLKPPPRSTSHTIASPPQPSPPISRNSHDTLNPPYTYTQVSSLANAMVASSLASSRAASPSKSPQKSPVPPPPPRRKVSKASLFHLHHNQSPISRTPSPTKSSVKPAGLARQTMREPPKTDKEKLAGGSGGGGHLVRKPHQHHEGDRKRYRTQLTERERKRYEGVWAANRGLLLPPPKSNLEAVNGEVLNLVVRDIWRRSRLPDHVLEEVWELVNLRRGHTLGREEFVVGMWLIDQRLKGNKLPTKVSESVWGSVRRLEGIKLPRRR